MRTIRMTIVFLLLISFSVSAIAASCSQYSLDKANRKKENISKNFLKVVNSYNNDYADDLKAIKVDTNKYTSWVAIFKRLNEPLKVLRDISKRLVVIRKDYDEAEAYSRKFYLACKDADDIPNYHNARSFHYKFEDWGRKSHTLYGEKNFIDLVDNEINRQEKLRQQLFKSLKENWFLLTQHEKDNGITKNIKHRLEKCIEAAEQGDLIAQYVMGGRYYRGEYIQQDYALAFKFVQLSAKQGLREAQSSLADMYEKGLGTKQSYEKAVYWYTKAAEQNSPPALYSLGYLYEDGNGVTTDLKTAYKYYKLADRHGYEKAKEKLKTFCKTNSNICK